MAKNPLELASEFTNPFNKSKISTEKESVSPSSFFKDGEFKRLVNMSPNDYFKFVAHQIGTTPEKLMEQRAKTPNLLSVDEIQQKMKEGVKFDTPWLRVTDRGEKGTTLPYWQEGLHRMLAAGREYGMDTKFPIYLGYENDPWIEMDEMPMDEFLNYYDTTRQKRYDQNKKVEELRRQQEEELDRQFAADFHGINIEQLTPELLKEYHKWEDSLWDIDDLEDL